MTATITAPIAAPSATRASVEVARRAETLFPYARRVRHRHRAVRAVLVLLPVRVRRRDPHAARRATSPTSCRAMWPRSCCSTAAASPSRSPRTTPRASPTDCCHCRSHDERSSSDERWPTPPPMHGRSSRPWRSGSCSASGSPAPSAKDSRRSGSACSTGSRSRSCSWSSGSSRRTAKPPRACR